MPIRCSDDPGPSPRRVIGAHAAFVLALMGYGRARVYDASMKEWANRPDTLLVTGGA